MWVQGRRDGGSVIANEEVRFDRGGVIFWIDSSMRVTTDVGGWVGSGGFRGGRALLSPGLSSQLPFLIPSRKVLKFANFSAGISFALTWLALRKQFSKQYPAMNQRGHILVVLSPDPH